MTLEDAIQKHSHEAAVQAQKYGALTPPQKQMVNAFLGSL
jgi:hypothetical protein